MLERPSHLVQAKAHGLRYAGIGPAEEDPEIAVREPPVDILGVADFEEVLLPKIAERAG
jgi:hypothetical protein